MVTTARSLPCTHLTTLDVITESTREVHCLMSQVKLGTFVCYCIDSTPLLLCLGRLRSQLLQELFSYFELVTNVTSSNVVSAGVPYEVVCGCTTASWSKYSHVMNTRASSRHWNYARTRGSWKFNGMHLVCAICLQCACMQRWPVLRFFKIAL